ncbi:MAG: PQQ-binding-like beta-propeller repeat protein, partial [Phycisphaerae bacterium]|nr:PQQ-binding-like beta-propeller repeat protein [Phycisphaerae bacterium]
PGPMVSTGKSRYYAPADCGPITLGDRMIVCDRGYMVGAYSPAGEVLATWETQVAGISPAADRKSYYARCTSNAVRRYAVDGTAIWETEVPAGRFPIPPTEHDGKLYICSNTGQLTALDAGSGQKLWSYQITPGFYVMAPVTVIDQGAKHPVCVIAGMDGTLTAIRHR